MNEAKPYPFLFRVGKWLQRHQVRGGYRLIGLSRRLGLLPRVAHCRVGNGIVMNIPMYREDNEWDEVDLASYEKGLITLLVSKLQKLPRPITLVDCGADIGVVSVLLSARSGCLDRVIAFEPNSEAYPTLASNISRLPLRGESHNMAISDFIGRGELDSPPYDKSNHAKFLVPSHNGSINVTTVDALGLSADGGFCLKVDVEGGELGVLRGALETLRRSSAFVVTIEANRDVFARTNVDPLECIRLLQSVRPCKSFVAELPDVALVHDRQFFSQVPGGRTYNIVCASE